MSDYKLIVPLVLINILTFATYGWDKYCARKKLWRISESTLLFMALLGGSYGALFAQQWFRHKTRKEPFRTILYTIAIVQFSCIGLYMMPPVRNALSGWVG